MSAVQKTGQYEVTDQEYITRHLLCCTKDLQLDELMFHLSSHMQGCLRLVETPPIVPEYMQRSNMCNRPMCS